MQHGSRVSGHKLTKIARIDDQGLLTGGFNRHVTMISDFEVTKEITVEVLEKHEAFHPRDM